MKILTLLFLFAILCYSQEESLNHNNDLLLKRKRLDSLFISQKIDSIEYKIELNKIDSVLSKQIKGHLSSFKNKTGILKGNRSVKQIESTATQYLKFVKEKYDKVLKKNKEFKGKMLINIIILPNGKVAASNCIESTMNNIIFEKEISEFIKEWKFDNISRESNDTAEVNYPFVFSH